MWQVRAVIRVLLTDPASELTKALRGHGVHPNWTLMALVDIAAGANWQRSGGRQARPRPFDQMLADRAQATALAEMQTAAQDPESDLFADLAYLSKFAPRPAEADQADGARSD